MDGNEPKKKEKRWREGGRWEGREENDEQKKKKRETMRTKRRKKMKTRKEQREKREKEKHLEKVKGRQGWKKGGEDGKRWQCMENEKDGTLVVFCSFPSQLRASTTISMMDTG